MDRKRRLLGICFGLLLAGTAAATAPGDLSGTWKLNRDASDDPRKKLEEARGLEGGSARGGFHGGGMGWHGGHRGGGRSSGEGGSSGSPDLFGDVDTLRIHHRDPKLVITDGAGREHVLYTDGRKVEEERSFGGTTKITARWKDGHVVVETRPEHGPSYTETYAVTADGRQLTVTWRLEGRGRRGDVEIRRVYDAAPPEEEATPAPAPDHAPPTSAHEPLERPAPLGPIRLEP